jgi:glutamate---cysteine ligase / carboxylate-amine ligase
MKEASSMSRATEVFTIGVEEEFQVIDPQTYKLSSDVEHILPRAREIMGEAIQYELILSQMEAATPVCRTLQEVRAELTHLRRTLIEAAALVGKCIAAAGTHPFSPWYEQAITPKARYGQLVDEYQRLIQEQIIFGCHVHIGVGDREVALELMNRARIWLSLLLALSANSPFYEGADTKYASYRTGLWGLSPLAGPPPFFASRFEHDTFVQALVATRSVPDATRIYWDIRLSARYETIEFRVMDVCMTIDETLLITGLIRALVRACHDAMVRGQPSPPVRAELLRTANWRAARYGLEGELIDVIAGRSVPARELLERFLAFVQPALEVEGDWEQVSRLLTRTLQQGNGAMRQREVFNRTRKVESVVQYIIDETARESSTAVPFC